MPKLLINNFYALFKIFNDKFISILLPSSLVFFLLNDKLIYIIILIRK